MATRGAGSTLRTSVPLLAYLALAAAVPAQEPVLDLTHDSAGGIVAYRQALLDATADRRVLVVATHPDDPYRGICAALRRHVGDRVRVLLATRGEGGQSAVGPVGEELGVVRTAESLEAARRLDVELRFLDLPDFGYSRTAAEALERWRGLEPERRLREEIAAFGPDLVVTPHGPHEAHGQKRRCSTSCAACSRGPRPRRCCAPRPRTSRPTSCSSSTGSTRCAARACARSRTRPCCCTGARGPSRPWTTRSRRSSRCGSRTRPGRATGSRGSGATSRRPGTPRPGGAPWPAGGPGSRPKSTPSWPG
ncbi:MAG: PIG-L family deacetylase [Planctomycetota bacterium]